MGQGVRGREMNWREKVNRAGAEGWMQLLLHKGWSGRFSVEGALEQEPPEEMVRKPCSQLGGEGSA